VVTSPVRIELAAPDITPYRTGNTGIDYVTCWESGKPGPHVLVNALTHGNEICGAIALDHLQRSGLRPVRGKLSLSFANVAAYESFDTANPTASRCRDEDFNRVWDKDLLAGTRRSVELNRARALRPLIDTVDLMLDIHSMQHATAPLMLTGLADKNVALARRVGVPALLVRDKGHASGRRLRDYGPFDDPAVPQRALLVECGQHWERRSAEVAIETVYRFLAAADILAENAAARYLTPPVPAQRLVVVTDAITVASDEFRFAGIYYGLEVIAKAGTLIAQDGGRAIRTPYDNCMLIMPTRRLTRGQTAVRLARFEE
jgi:predicted deacylase